MGFQMDDASHMAVLSFFTLKGMPQPISGGILYL